MSSCAFGVLKAMQNFYFSRLLISSGFSLSKKMETLILKTMVLRVRPGINFSSLPSWQQLFLWA
jgi:hypothetical protein